MSSVAQSIKATEIMNSTGFFNQFVKNGSVGDSTALTGEHGNTSYISIEDIQFYAPNYKINDNERLVCIKRESKAGMYCISKAVFLVNIDTQIITPVEHYHHVNGASASFVTPDGISLVGEHNGIFGAIACDILLGIDDSMENKKAA